MALTVTNDTGSKGVERISRNYGMLSGAIAFDSSYPTGGELATDISKYFKTILQLQIEGANGYTYEYDKTNNKIVVYTPTDAIAAHTHDLTYIGGITATEAVAIDGGDTLGKNAATNRTIAGVDFATKGGVNTAGAVTAAAASEVGAAVDLSGITAAKFIAIGLI